MKTPPWGAEPPPTSWEHEHGTRIDPSQRPCTSLVLIWRPMAPGKIQTGTVFAAPTRARSTPCGGQGWGERETHPASRPQMAPALLSCGGSRRVTSLLGSVCSRNCEVEMRTHAKCVNCDTHRCIAATHLPSSCLPSLVTCQVILRGVAKGGRHI